jgi:hypothetical protein
MLKKLGFVKILPAYRCETHSRSVHDKYTGNVYQIIKAEDSAGYVEIQADCDEVSVHRDRCEAFDRHAVKITYSDGDFHEGWINGTRDQVTAYYAIGTVFNRGIGGGDKCVEVTKLEFLVDIVEPPIVEEKPYIFGSDFVPNEQAAEWVRKHT